MAGIVNDSPLGRVTLISLRRHLGIVKLNIDLPREIVVFSDSPALVEELVPEDVELVVPLLVPDVVPLDVEVVVPEDVEELVPLLVELEVELLVED